MGYVLAAFIASEAVLRQEMSALEHSYVASLPQGLGLVPVTDQFFDEVSLDDPERTDDTYPQFTYLSSNLEKLALRISVLSPVAYVEADYFGGVGGQLSIVWQDSKVVLKPVEERNIDRVLISQGAINAALRILGVEHGSYHDEFDALRLGRHRDTDDWNPQLQQEIGDIPDES